MAKPDEKTGKPASTGPRKTIDKPVKGGPGAGQETRNAALQAWMDQLMAREAQRPAEERHAPAANPITDDEIIQILNRMIPAGFLDEIPAGGGPPWTADHLPPPPDVVFGPVQSLNQPFVPSRGTGGQPSKGDQEHDTLHLLGRIPPH